MTKYSVTAWCDRPFYAQCEVEADSPEEALAKARLAVQDAPAEECDDGYFWDEWRVDTETSEGVLLHLDDPARPRATAPKLLEALQGMVRWAELHNLTMAELGLCTFSALRRRGEGRVQELT
jgi:hypothetical protein